MRIVSNIAHVEKGAWRDGSGNKKIKDHEEILGLTASISTLSQREFKWEREKKLKAEPVIQSKP